MDRSGAPNPRAKTSRAERRDPSGMQVTDQGERMVVRLPAWPADAARPIALGAGLVIGGQILACLLVCAGLGTLFAHLLSSVGLVIVVLTVLRPRSHQLVMDRLGLKAFHVRSWRVRWSEVAEVRLELSSEVASGLRRRNLVVRTTSGTEHVVALATRVRPGPSDRPTDADLAWVLEQLNLRRRGISTDAAAVPEELRRLVREEGP